MPVDVPMADFREVPCQASALKLCLPAVSPIEYSMMGRQKPGSKKVAKPFRID
jgi:hypothetical protein